MSREVPEQDAAESVRQPAQDERAGGVFMMGEFQAVFPSHLRYTTNHMWASPVTGSPAELTSPTDLASSGDVVQRWRFGLTAYAVRLLQDVYFLDWLIEPPAVVSRRQILGSIESKKAESDLYSPTAGQLVGFNGEALADPSVINVDLYDAGWLFELAAGSSEDLLDLAAYLEHLEQAWPVAQRTIKGQI